LRVTDWGVAEDPHKPTMRASLATQAYAGLETGGRGGEAAICRKWYGNSAPLMILIPCGELDV
jgi:hypothetical protein